MTTPATPQTFAEKRLEQLVEERAALASKRTELDDRIKDIDALLTEQLDKGTHQIAGYKVIVTQPARLDSAKLAEAFPVVRFPEYYKPALDTASVKADISANALAQFQTVGRKQLRIS